jgi:hypothetical protein
MNGLDVVFSLLVAAALTMALRAAVRTLACAWGLERDREVAP